MSKLQKTLITALSLTLCLPSIASAVTTLKQVQVSSGARIDLLFDGKLAKNQVRAEFFNDVIQIILSDVAVYPAKISSVNGGDLVKIFAYQYAPKLVRCRLTVKGKAEDFKDRLQLDVSGRVLSVRLAGAGATQDSVSIQSAHPMRAPVAVVREEVPAKAALSSNTSSDKDAALLEHVTQGQTAKSVPVQAPISRETEKSLPRASAGLGLAGGKPLPSPMAIITKLLGVIALFGALALAAKKVLGQGSSSLGARKLNARVARGENKWMSALGGIAKNAAAGLGRREKMIEVLSNHHLGPKKSIAVVRIMGKTMVLGVTNESINLISQMSAEMSSEMAAAESEFEEESEAEMDIEKLLKATHPAARPVASNTGAAGKYSQDKFSSLLSAETKKPSARSQIRSRLEGLKQL